MSSSANSIRPQHANSIHESVGKVDEKAPECVLQRDEPQEPINPLSENAPHEPVEAEEEHGAEVDEHEDDMRQDGQAALPPPPPRPGARARALPKPVTPTRAEREAHDVSHLPPMPWCRH